MSGRGSWDLAIVFKVYENSMKENYSSQFECSLVKENLYFIEAFAAL